MPEIYQQTAGHLPLTPQKDFITLMVRDPHWLYAYWDISENRINLLKQEFGSDFLDKSVPILKVRNISKSESFCIRINDFSNDWHFNVADANCIYAVEIGRKVSDNFFSLINSNNITTPGENVSDNFTAYFIDYNALRQGRHDAGMLKKSPSIVNYPLHVPLGISSMEFSSSAEKVIGFGESSAQYYGKW